MTPVCYFSIFKHFKCLDFFSSNSQRFKDFHDPEDTLQDEHEETRRDLSISRFIMIIFSIISFKDEFSRQLRYLQIKNDVYKFQKWFWINKY